MNPKEHIEFLHVIRRALALGILSKEEVFAWVDSIIVTEEKPDVFFLDLTLLENKPSNRLITHFSEYLNFEETEVWGNPLLGMLYRAYTGGHITLEQTGNICVSLMYNTNFSNDEFFFLCEIDIGFSYIHAKMNFQPQNEFEDEIKRFLSIYQDYRIDNYSEWKRIDSLIKGRLEDFKQAEFERKTKLSEKDHKNIGNLQKLKNSFWRIRQHFR